MIRSYKFRLFTNANQERELSQTLESHRRLYNAALDGQQLCWETAGHHWSFAEQCRWMARVRRSNPFWSKLIAGSCVKTLKRLDGAMQSFFRRIKKVTIYLTHRDRMVRWGYSLNQ